MVGEGAGGDSPISAIYGNPDIPYEEPLEVNGCIPNLIILSDISMTSRSFVKIGGNSLSPSNKNKEGNSHIIVYLKFVVRLTFLSVIMQK